MLCFVACGVIFVERKDRQIKNKQQTPAVPPPLHSPRHTSDPTVSLLCTLPLPFSLPLPGQTRVRRHEHEPTPRLHQVRPSPRHGKRHPSSHRVAHHQVWPDPHGVAHGADRLRRQTNAPQAPQGDAAAVATFAISVLSADVAAASAWWQVRISWPSTTATKTVAIAAWGASCATTTPVAREIDRENSVPVRKS